MSGYDGPGFAFVLGAGSSVYAGAPTLSQFRKRARELSEPPGDQVSDTFLGEERLRDRFNDALEMWEDRGPTQDVEGFYNQLEMGVVLDSMDVSERDLQDFQYLIAKVLSVTTDHKKVRPHHSFFAHRFAMKTVGQRIRNSAIITTNWDNVTENALAAADDLGWSYGHPRAETYEGDLIGQDDGPPLDVLKLHGSINWQFCPDCGILFTSTSDSVLDTWEEGNWPCRKCNSTLEPVFVPPTSGKLKGGAEPIGEVWDQAYNCLRSAEQIIFVGYSFPRTDVHMRSLISRALTDNDFLRNIKIVTNPKFGRRRLSFEERYIDVLGDLGVTDRVEFEYSSWEEFAGDPSYGTLL